MGTPPPPPPPPLLAAALVVTIYVLTTHPTVSVALLAVEFAGDDTSLTTIVSPELVVPVRVVNGVLLILYSPPTTETTACALIPDIVIGLDMYAVESSAPATAEKLNTVGVVSAGRRNAKSES